MTALESPLGRLPTGWSLAYLKDLTTKVGSGATPRGGASVYLSSRTNYALIRSQNVFDREFDSTEIAYINDEAAEQLSSAKVQRDDVLINITGDGVTFARACKVPSRVLPACVSQHVCILRTDTRKCLPGYLHAYLTTAAIKPYIGSFNTGASRRAITKGAIEKFVVPVPPLRVQERISAVLSGYDDLIENCELRIKVLDEMARALYREWFVEFRYPGYAASPLVASEFGQIPRGWKPAAIEEVCARVTDGAHASPASVSEGMPMASSKDMYEWGLDLSTARQISQDDYSSLVRSGCRPLVGDVLIIKDGANYLKHIFVHRDEMDVVLLSSVAMLRSNDRITPSLLAAILKSPDNRSRLKNFVTGAAIPRIVLKDFKAFRFLLPSREVQAAWTKVGEPFEIACWKLSILKDRLRATRDLLLPRFLSGELTFKVSV